MPALPLLFRSKLGRARCGVFRGSIVVWRHGAECSKRRNGDEGAKAWAEFLSRGHPCSAVFPRVSALAEYPTFEAQYPVLVFWARVPRGLNSFTEEPPTTGDCSGMEAFSVLSETPRVVTLVAECGRRPAVRRFAFAPFAVRPQWRDRSLQ